MYEVVYSAALERQGLGMSISGFQGQSTLIGFDAIEGWRAGEAREIAHSLRNYDPQLIGNNKRYRSPWHRNRSKQAA
jgi:hypothetical protein